MLNETEGQENLGCALFNMTVRSAPGTRGMAQLGSALGEETRHGTARSLKGGVCLADFLESTPYICFEWPKRKLLPCF